ncbi:MAG TPA: outer membrane protein transport protein [Lysobacter sp.]|nr:outer membrane protein transport protein [Lysobacter sp.]
MNQAIRYTLSALTLGIAGVLAVGQAHATGFQLRETSVKNLGRGQAGVATASDDASVVTNNPAAMVNLDKNTVQADVTAIDISFQFEGGGTSAAGTPLTGGDGGNAGGVQAVPNLSVVFPLQGAFEGLTVGAAIGAPFGLKTEYDRDWVGRYNAVESDLKVVDFTLSAAVELGDRFSLGVGAIYERADVTLSNAIDLGTIMFGTGIPGALPQGADGFATIEGDSNSMGWLFGAQWKPTDQLSIGYAHRSEIDHDIEGTGDFTTPASFQAAQGAYRASAAACATMSPPTDPCRALIPTLLGLGNGFVDTDATAKLTTPSIDTLSVQYDISDSIRVMADAQWTDWSSLREVNVDFANPFQPNSIEDFSWTDTEMYALGAEWDLSDSFTLRGGITMDETPTHLETRTPRLPDNDRMLYSIGFTWNISDALSVDAAYQRIEIDNSPVDIRSSSGSRLVGDFDGYANLFGVAAQYKF